MGPWIESLVPWGTEVIVWVQSVSPPWLEIVSRLLTFLGDKEAYLLLGPILYWCLHRRIGVGLAYASLLSAWTAETIKDIFQIPRPNDPRIRVLVTETSPSFASAHAQNAVVIWGYLALRFRNWIPKLVAVLLILGIGLSRIVLGVHYPHDVLAGWLFGLVLLAVFARAEEPVARWVAAQSRAVQFALAAGVPLLLIFLHPADAQGLYPVDRAITPMATLAGFGVGVIMERSKVRFQVGGPWWRCVLRVLVGLAVLGLFYLAPSVLLPEDMAYGLESLARFVRYALVGWVAAFVCPWLFLRLRLAERERSGI